MGKKRRLKKEEKYLKKAMKRSNDWERIEELYHQMMDVRDERKGRKPKNDAYYNWLSYIEEQQEMKTKEQQQQDIKVGCITIIILAFMFFGFIGFVGCVATLEEEPTETEQTKTETVEKKKTETTMKKKEQPKKVVKKDGKYIVKLIWPFESNHYCGVENTSYEDNLKAGTYHIYVDDANTEDRKTPVVYDIFINGEYKETVGGYGLYDYKTTLKSGDSVFIKSFPIASGRPTGKLVLEKQ